MTIRSDITMDWESSPRVITVDAPSVEITIQDLHDTCRHLEATPIAMDNPILISTAGLENLGGGTKVGLTATLQNALVAFEARLGPTYEQCRVNGGNLVALQSDLATNFATPISPTAFTQVVTTASSSATSSEQDAIQYSTYQGAAWYKANSGNTGVEYPNGNVEFPVDDLTDAVSVCNTKGFRVIQVIDDLETNDITHDIRDLKLIGVSHVNSQLVVGADTQCLRTSFDGFDISGVLDGDSEITNCIVKNLTYFNGHIHNSYLEGAISLRGSKDANIENCKSNSITATTIIDAGGTGQNLMMPNWSGPLIISNLTGNSELGIGVDAGEIIIDSSCTAGIIGIAGNGSVTDNSGDGCYVVNKSIDGTDIQNLQRLIENIRPHHTGTGNVWFWSPDLGSDTLNDGKHPKRAFKTWAETNLHIIDNNHDIIMLVPDNTTGNTIITEKIVIDKNYVFIRGPGRDIQFDVPDINGAIAITGNGVELSGFRIKNALGDAVHSTGLFTMLNNIWIKDCVNGVNIEGAYPVIQNTKINLISGFGIKLQGNVSNGEITNCKIGGVGANGLDIDLNTGFGGIVIKDTVVVKSAGYGIYLSATTEKVMINNNCTIENNTLGNVNNLGSFNVDHSNLLTQDTSENEDFNTLGGAITHLKHLEYKIFIDTESIEPLLDQDGSQKHPYSVASTAIDYAEDNGLLNLQIKTDIDLIGNLRNFYVTSTNIKKIDTGVNNLEGSRFSHIELFGNYTGYVTAQDCHLTGGSLHGNFQNCSIGSNFLIPDLGYAFVKDCTDFTEGFISPPSFDIGGLSGTARLHLKNHTGGAKIKNCNQTTDEVKIVSTGQIEIDSSNTNGSIIIFGLIKPIDNSGVGCNVMWESVTPSEIKDTYIGVSGHRKSVGLIDTHYNDDGSIRKSFDITEDIDGSVIEVTPQ